MPAMSLPAEGGCRCGALRVRVTRQPLCTSACHCTGCQRMSGSAFSTTAILPVEGFEVIRGTPVAGGLKGPSIHHHHCPGCLSWVFTTFTPARPFVNLRAVMLDDAAWFAPFIETCTAEKLPWAETGAAHSYEGFPPEEDFAALLADYAARCGHKEH